MQAANSRRTIEQTISGMFAIRACLPGLETMYTSVSSGINAYQYFSTSVKAQLKGAEGDRWALQLATRKEEW